MVPARNLLRRHYDSYGGFFGDFYQERPGIRASLMAEEPSRGAEDQEQEEDRRGEAGTSSKEADDHRYENWLRLGIGSSAAPLPQPSSRPAELELLSGGPALPRPPPPPPAAGILPGPPAVVPLFAPAGGMAYRREAPWGFLNPAPVPPVLQYNYRQFLYPPPGGFAGEGGMRVVSPPRRQQAGVWFALQAAQNQGKEPFLPQIPKSYLRIKDGRMTVRLLIKYLVSKLGLESESEVEITCRGHQLHPLLTLQQVRDNIWCSREIAVMLILPDSPSTDHVMTLHYRRSG